MAQKLGWPGVTQFGQHTAQMSSTDRVVFLLPAHGLSQPTPVRPTHKAEGQARQPRTTPVRQSFQPLAAGVTVATRESQKPQNKLLNTSTIHLRRKIRKGSRGRGRECREEGFKISYLQLLSKIVHNITAALPSRLPYLPFNQFCPQTGRGGFLGCQTPEAAAQTQQDAPSLTMTFTELWLCRFLSSLTVKVNT